MFDNLEVLRMAHGLAQNAGARQGAIARNVANADTPGYKAQAVAPFAETYGRQVEPFAMRATRAGHLTGAAGEAANRMVAAAGGAESPNGNNVSVEQEMVKAAEVRQSHDMALSIYTKSLGILRTSLGR